MRTQLEVAQRLGGRAPTGRAVADDLLTDTERLARLVDDLLLLARADDAGGAARRPRPAEPVELGQLLAEVRRPLSRRRRSRVRPPTRPLLDTRASRTRCDRVVANLLDNAVRHTRTRVVVGGGRRRRRTS